MFVQLRKCQKESGIILIIVIIILLTMASISIGIFSQSLNQTKNSRSQVDEIVAEQLVKGSFYTAYNSLDPINTNPINAISNYSLNGRSFIVNTTFTLSGTSYNALSVATY